MNKYPETIEDLKTDRLEIIEEIKISITESGNEITDVIVKNIMKRIAESLNFNSTEELDIWEMIEAETENEFRPVLVDLHAINLSYAKQNLPSSLR